MELNKIIGKKIISIRGFKRKCIAPIYILLDDGETFIDLTEQDEYDYHDCNSSARLISVCQNKNWWKEIKTDNKKYGDANTDF